MPASRPIIVTTISISTSVTPASRLFVIPADDIRVVAFPARLAVARERNDVWFVAVVAWIFVVVRVAPRIGGNVLREIRARPLGHALRPHAESIQALFRTGE